MCGLNLKEHIFYIDNILKLNLMSVVGALFFKKSSRRDCLSKIG